VTVSWTREQRLAVDRTEVGTEAGTGKVVFDGPVPEPPAAAVEELMRKLILDLQAEGRQGVSA
jgi:hypothetical protein